MEIAYRLLAIDPAFVCQRVLHTGAQMPAMGLGTFGSDHVSASEIAAAVEGAASVAYRQCDCAFVYGKERESGYALQKSCAPGV
jgi:alcohol dehydrogenase (NADP+)